MLPHLHTIFLLLPHLLAKPYDPAEHTDEDISVHASLVGFIDNNDRIFRQQEVGSKLTEQYTVSHELDGGVR